MTRYYSFSILLIFAVFFGCNQSNSTSETSDQTENSEVIEQQKVEPQIQELGSKEFGELVLNKDVVLVDVRTPDEFVEGHIPNALNIDVTNSNFQENIDKIERDQPVYIYCRSGGRSGQAMSTMQEMGFTNLIELENGILEWNSETMPTTKE